MDPSFPRTSPDPFNPHGGRTRAFTMLGLTTWLEQTHGTAALEQFAATLPPAMGEAVRQRRVSTDGWVPIEMYYAGVRFVVDRYHQGDPLAARELARRLRAQDIGLAFRVVLNLASPGQVIKLAAQVWSSYGNEGQMTALALDEHHAIGELRGYPYNDEVVINDLGGSVLSYIEHSRGQNVQLDAIEVPRSGLIRFVISWS